MLEQLAEMLHWKKNSSYYASKLGITVAEVEELRKELKERKKSDREIVEEILEPKWEVTSTKEGFQYKTIDQKNDHITGESTIILQSNKPLSPQEIDELTQVDNISTFVKMSWLKSQKDATWTYSIQTIRTIKDFYSSKELDIKLKEIFKAEAPVCSIKPSSTSNEALFIYIADDHAGLVLKNSLYNKEYSGKTYAQRLLSIVDEVKSLDKSFSKIIVVRLGDEMDGWNGKTTRYDHDLGSVSNKEQFDIYATANKLFYDELFSSELANDYVLYTLGNSNHTGKGFSYIANKALEFWLEAKFPFVEVLHQEKFIDVISFGNHIIGFTHGKDEQYMKSPMPLNLDYKTDLWLMDYYKQYQQKGMFISTIKGDIHKYNVNHGKSGRYVNVPSIATNSAWVEHNFGDSDSGAILEIYKADSKNIQTIPIWF